LSGSGVDPVVALHLWNAADYRLGRLSGLGVGLVVALRLRNAAEYRLPTFGPHGTKLGHS